MWNIKALHPVVYKWFQITPTGTKPWGLLVYPIFFPWRGVQTWQKGAPHIFDYHQYGYWSKWNLLWVCYFPIGILGQVWYLIVSIPDLCTLTYFDPYQLFSVLTHLFLDMLSQNFYESLYLYLKQITLLLSSCTVWSPINQNRSIPMHICKNIGTGMIVLLPSLNMLHFYSEKFLLSVSTLTSSHETDSKHRKKLVTKFVFLFTRMVPRQANYRTEINNAE